jgi:hypothetical protein
LGFSLIISSFFLSKHKLASVLSILITGYSLFVDLLAKALNGLYCEVLEVTFDFCDRRFTGYCYYSLLMLYLCWDADFFILVTSLTKVGLSGFYTEVFNESKVYNYADVDRGGNWNIINCCWLIYFV